MESRREALLTGTPAEVMAAHEELIGAVGTLRRELDVVNDAPVLGAVNDLVLNLPQAGEAPDPVVSRAVLSAVDTVQTVQDTRCS